MVLLELISEESEHLQELNGQWTWAIVNTFRLTEPATSDDYLSEMITWASKLQHFYFGNAHGPYRLDALASSNYVPCSPQGAEKAFSTWISEFCGPNSTDPERILSELIRPHIADAELFRQTGIYDEYEECNDPDGKGGKEARRAFHEWYLRVLAGEDPKLVDAAGILMGWIEVVAIDREAGTLTMVITSAD